LFVSQETAFVMLGITSRKFREIVVPLCRGSVVRVGKSALIPADVAEERLKALADDSMEFAADPETHAAGDGRGTTEPQTLSEILRAVGRERIAP
jgi:hypothetical protein